MLKRISIILAMASLLAACSETGGDVAQTENCSKGTFMGVIDVNKSILEASMDDNATHAQEFCVFPERCVRVFGTKDGIACSNLPEGKLKCKVDGEEKTVDALSDVFNCGACGEECMDNEICDQGFCRNKEDETKECEQGEAKCATEGNYLLECDKNNKWVEKENCSYKCDADNKKCIDRICIDDDIKCDADGKTLKKCTDNDWVDVKVCGYKCDEKDCVEKVCDENESKCNDEKNAQLVCINNAWTTTPCQDGCEDNKCNDHICTKDETKCSDDKSSILVCGANTWAVQKGCGTNEVCDEATKDCVCAPGTQTCTGKEGCFDLNTDRNNCGECGNSSLSLSADHTCQDGKVCVVNGGRFAEKVSEQACCDPAAKPYYYLVGNKECSNKKVDAIVGGKFDSYYSSGRSPKYCITQEIIDKFYPDEASKCFVSEEEFSHLGDVEACGYNNAYNKCNFSVATTVDEGRESIENIAECRAGRCCLPNGRLVGGHQSTVVEFKNYTFNAADCCGGYAYRMSGSNMGGWTYCTSQADYCLDYCLKSLDCSASKCEWDTKTYTCTRSSGLSGGSVCTDLTPTRSYMP